MKTSFYKNGLFWSLLCVILLGVNGCTNSDSKDLPRGVSSDAMQKAVKEYFEAAKEAGQDIHSLMVVQHGKVIAEEWLGDNAPDKPHILNSVSKTFTATAIGFAAAENKLKVSDKVISYFPESLPDTISPYLQDLEIRDLLSMTVGQDIDLMAKVRTLQEPGSWEKEFLATPIVHEPGTKFVYNSVATYMLSAIVQKVTGQKTLDYLSSQLFEPLGIVGATWEESPSGVNLGGWGLYLKTEDLAKMGQFLLQKGEWKGKQLLPADWIEEASSAKIMQWPDWISIDTKSEDSDWMQGYCYQMWRCRHNAYRADGANGQFIIVLPDQDAVIAVTAQLDNMQTEINLLWKYILPAL